MQALPKLPTVCRVSPLVMRILGHNPSPYTLQGTNSYLLGAGPQRILVDTSNPDMPDYVATVKDTLQKEKCSISDIVLTHWHKDHVGSVSDLLIMCESATGQRPVVHRWPAEVPQAAKYLSFPWKSLEHSQDQCSQSSEQWRPSGILVTPNGDCTLHIYHTPGHTLDHVVLVLLEELALFSADLILGHGSTTFENLVQYMESLHRVTQLYRGSPALTRIYPGHGEFIVEGEAKLQEYVQHRETRIQQVVHFLGQETEPLTADVLCAKVYSEVQGSSLWMGAMRNLEEALSYLEHKGRVVALRNQGEVKWSVRPSS